MKLSGTVVYEDLEGGLYLLKASNGNTYLLDGGGSDLLVDGVSADVEGEVQEAGMGIGMTGHSILVVASYTVKSRG